MVANTKLYLIASASKPTTNVPNGGTEWAQCKSPGAQPAPPNSNYPSTDRNPFHWTANANYWFSWGGLTANNGKHYVEVGSSNRHIKIDPQSGDSYQAFSIASTGDIVCLEKSAVDGANGSTRSSNYTVTAQTGTGNSGKYLITESAHLDGGAAGTPVDGDHFYVFPTVGSGATAKVLMVDPLIRNDEN